MMLFNTTLDKLRIAYMNPYGTNEDGVNNLVYYFQTYADVMTDLTANDPEREFIPREYFPIIVKNKEM